MSHKSDIIVVTLFVNEERIICYLLSWSSGCSTSVQTKCHRVDGRCYDDALFLFQMKTADATTQVTAPSARYKFMLS